MLAIMERRKRNEAYAKLLIKEQKCSDSNNDENEAVEQLPAFRRTNSVRASLRRLRGKLHAPSALQSPFNIRGPLSLRSKHIKKRYSKAADKSTVAKRYSTVLKMYQSCEDLSSVALISSSSKRYNTNEPTRYVKNKTDMSLNEDCGIEQLMSGLPLGSVPRKACKLLQIPETYCLKYLAEQQQQLKTKHPSEGSILNSNNTENILNNNKTNTPDKKHSIDVCEKQYSLRQGIYGSTRLRTATIRKPVPYLNSSRLKLM